ncbi:serine-rich adhesin for platelets [Sabethes cyaneus]|uniref:serine-rich adhesin for platelets n=1 Tax=Sabethes cyaneus TaxID=53552 RepID=UPI00237E60DC|nr:serine-rich adhesin for platelets [Sabethes cyaneus]XP_053696183.1 serine-rich adhesin for platelets [Sabethes cyaneus]
MSKDLTQSRIPRIGTTSSSRIPIPGSIRPAQFQSKLAKPSSYHPPSAPFATPARFLGPQRSTGITIARSYSGDKLCGESAPFPALAASTPAPFRASSLNLFKKLDLTSTENLNDTKQIDLYRAESTSDVDVDSDGRMLVDESLDLVGAGSTDNLLSTETFSVGGMLKPPNETVTLNYDGNVTYEVKRSETFVKSSQESLKLGGSRESLNQTSGASSSSFQTSKSGSDVSLLDKTHTLDTESKKPKVALSSTMVYDKLVNVTQCIPNITQELDKTAVLPKVENILNNTHVLQSPEQLLTMEPAAQRPTRLTFNLNETTDLLHLSDPSQILNKTQVFCSTMHSPLAVTTSSNALNLTRDIKGSSLEENVHLLDLPFDADRTLTAAELELDDDQARVVLEDAGIQKKGSFDLSLEEPLSVGKDDIAVRPLEGRSSIPAKQRFSFGLDLTECTLDCSIELCDSSLSSTKPHIKSPVSNSLTKQGSFEMDESLGIFTPDQMKEFLDSTTTNTHNTKDLELQLSAGSHKHGLHHCRIDQTPSPEELPLDPVGVKTDMSDIMLPSEILPPPGPILYQEISQADSESKTDQMTKSANSKVSNSFITSITSITSLDTGYQGDGEMSRPASRGADHSPSNGPRIKNQGAAAWNVQPAPPVPRRQDPMTDSDFFTESDADDVFNRGDRRAQIIDGQLYGPMMQGANVFINQHPQNDDSCMESSGIFTDVDNRGEDDLVHRRLENDDRAEREPNDSNDGGEGRQVGESDMSPDASTDTLSSSNTACSQKKVISVNSAVLDPGMEGVNCLQNSSLISSVSTNASSPGVFGEKSFGSDAATADLPGDHGGDVTRHVFTPSSVVTSSATTATQNQSASLSPSSSASLLNGKADSITGSGGASGGGGCSGSNTTDSVCNFAVARGASNTSSDSLSGAPVGGGSRNSSFAGGSGKKPCSSSRKQQKNETNLVLKKHEMSSRAALIKTRLFKDTSTAVSSRSVGGSVQNLDVENECENQENKRPIRANNHRARAIGGGGNGVSASVGNLSFTKKSATPNKWDAVMSKIAENKAVIKKNFSDVKSKISCGKAATAGLSSRRIDSPASLKSPPSECNSVGGRSVGTGPTAGAKRTVKRTRNHSKDSSQSDISLTGGSPKMQLKLPNLRPAKKRDVRTINSSSSDLGPPSKSSTGQPQPQQQQQPQQQPLQQQRANLRTPAALQKRISANVTNASAPGAPDQMKGSPPSRRNLIAKRTLSAATNGSTTAQQVVKTPLKDHNRLVGPTATAKLHSPKPQPKALLRPAATTTTTAPPNSAAPNSHSHPGSNGTTVNHSVLKNGANNLPRNGTIILDKSSSALAVGAEDAAPAADAKSVNGTGGGTDRKVSSVVDSVQSLSPKVVGAKTTAKMPPASGTNRNLVDISLLNHANRGVEALGVLVQYLVFNLDAFSCPTIKKSHQEATHDLLETKSMLNEERSTCELLKQQLVETTEREAELQELHRCEINKVGAYLSEQQHSAADRIAALEAQLLRTELEADDKLRTTVEEFEAKLAERDAELTDSKQREAQLLQRINDLSCTENELREKVHSSELEFSERLQAAAMRERELSDQLKQLTHQLQEMRNAAADREQELEEKLSLTQDECSFLRHSRNSSEPPQGTESPGLDRTFYQRSSLNGDQTPGNNKSTSNLNQAQVLHDEVDSLRCVLDLKQREISELRKQTQEYERDAKELPGALVKISALESRIEDLQVQLKTKAEEEKELQHRLKLLQDNLKQETKVKSRLSQHNEELQWKLKQNSEKFSHVYAELSKSYHENSSFMTATRASLDQSGSYHNHTVTHNSTNRSTGSDKVFEMDDISPPTSPVIKGVVEKSDSVSWVLEMDDEPPEISASRMVRRAGSFRSAYASTGGQELKRHKCGATAGLSHTYNGGGIQQSSSVGSILKQQDGSPSKNSSSPSTPRLRSKSVSIKTAEPPKKIVRSNSGASSSTAAVSKPIKMAELPMSWKDPPLYSSSPYAHKRFLNERMMENGGTGSKSFAGFRDGKDLFLEETEFSGEVGPDSPFSRSRTSSFGAGPVEATPEQPPAEFFHRDRTPNFKMSKENRGLITCDTKALTGSGGETAPAHKKRREFARNNLAGKKNCSLPKEAAGEALVSGSNSEDEASSSSCLSDDISSAGSGHSSSSSSSSSSSTSTSTGSGPTSSGRDQQEEQLVGGDDEENDKSGSVGAASNSRRRRSSNDSLEDVLMQKIVASLNRGISGVGNDTPMEVSWSEDGDPSESIV